MMLMFPDRDDMGGAPPGFLRGVSDGACIGYAAGFSRTPTEPVKSIRAPGPVRIPNGISSQLRMNRSRRKDPTNQSFVKSASDAVYYPAGIVASHSNMRVVSRGLGCRKQNKGGIKPRRFMGATNQFAANAPPLMGNIDG